MADKLVTVAEYMDSIQAEMARQVLEDFEIRAIIVGPNSGDGRIGIFEAVKLQVLESDADKAKQILEDQEQSFEPGESPEFNELGGYEEPEEQ
jgi:hypothetical protein